MLMMTQEAFAQPQNQAGLLSNKTRQRKQETCPLNNKTLVAPDPQPCPGGPVRKGMLSAHRKSNNSWTRLDHVGTGKLPCPTGRKSMTEA